MSTKPTRKIVGALFLLSISFGILGTCPAPSIALPAAIPSVDLDPAGSQQSLTAYANAVRDKILQHWKPPVHRTPTDTAVSFTVNKDGAITEAQIIQTCGDAEADQHALAIVRSLSPLEPLPAGSDDIVIDLIFSPKPVDSYSDSMGNLGTKKKAAEENPQSAQQQYDYGRALRFSGASKEAIEYLQKAIDLKMDGPEPCLELGQAYRNVKNDESAEKWLKEAVARKPDHVASLKALGEFYFDRKRWPDAIQAYKELLKAQPSGPLTEFAKDRIELCEHGGEEPEDE